MDGHPGGIKHTMQMLSISKLLPPAKILDMGAGKGNAVQYLCSLGYEAMGIDFIAPSNKLFIKGDFLHPPFEIESFDGILSQCSFYISGQPKKAFSVAYQLLKTNGILMLSDVCPRDTTLKILAEDAGFTILHCEDQTAVWKEYYIEAIWRGTAQSFPCNQKINYEMLICKK